MIDQEKRFLTGLKQISKIGFILVIVLSAAACNNQEDSQSGSMLENNDMSAATSSPTQMYENNEDRAALSQDINKLMLEKDTSLMISQHNDIFIPASPSFSERIMNLLSSHGSATAKVVDVGEYDLVLRFDGYKDMYLNLNTNSFWFAGDDHVYPIHIDFKMYWDRYMIRIINEMLMYDAFEKTILSKLTFADQNGALNTATLFYDGDVRLEVNETQIEIASNVSESSLSYDSSRSDLSSYSVQPLGNEPLIAVVNDFHAMNGPSTTLDLFSHTDEQIQKIFSTSDMTFEIEAIDYDKADVTIRLPFANTTIMHSLTSDERKRTEEILAELKEKKIDIDNEFIQSMKGQITHHPVEVNFIKADHGAEEIHILTNIKSVGAKTPMRMNTSIIVMFEIKDNSLQYKEVAFAD